MTDVIVTSGAGGRRTARAGEDGQSVSRTSTRFIINQQTRSCEMDMPTPVCPQILEASLVIDGMHGAAGDDRGRWRRKQ